MSYTDIAAWYAAGVATVVLAWDAVKWFRGEPRLRVSARGNVGYPDSAVIETKQIAGVGEAGTLATYCHVEVVNVGGRPTTLIDIEATNADEARVFASSIAFVAHVGSGPLPARLGPGEMWSARLDMRRLEAIRSQGVAVIRVRASHKVKAIDTLISGIAATGKAAKL